jgi:16S rRNA (adenine1518-N6/adenine1519-N6)-dimethyltransferase
VRIDVYDRPLLADAEREWFFQVVRAGFGQKRKTLRNALMMGLDQPAQSVEAWLEASGIDGRRRAETLSLEEWRRLAKAIQP